MSFSALAIVGDRNGRIGFAHSKAKDASSAISRAMAAAKKNVSKVLIKDGTISHQVYLKSQATKLLLKPAPKGAGIIAGGAVRHVLELAGYKDVSAKMLGSSNKLSSIQATVKALRSLKG